MSVVLKHYKQYPELRPLFAIIAFGCGLSGFYLTRLATKGLDVSWNRSKNPHPWLNVPPGGKTKFFDPHGKQTSAPHPFPQEAVDAIAEA